MSSDIRVSIDFFDHPKTVKVKRRCGVEGVLCLQRLWAWASQHHPNGDLSGMDFEDIEIAAKWDGDPGVFFEAIKNRFLDIEGDSISLHDWQEHNPWAATSEVRADKGRLNRMKKTHPEIYQLFQSVGADSISKKDYSAITTSSKPLRAAQAILKEPFKEQQAQSPSPAPAPTPTPTPIVKPSIEDLKKLHSDHFGAILPNNTQISVMKRWVSEGRGFDEIRQAYETAAGAKPATRWGWIVELVEGRTESHSGSKPKAHGKKKGPSKLDIETGANVDFGAGW